MIRIFSEGTCDLSKELVDRYNITIIPGRILLGDKDYKDSPELDRDMIYKWADKNRTTPKTSAPLVEDAMEKMKPVIDSGDEIISFCISESMSQSGAVMRMVADELDAEDRVTVIDSMNLSTGIGLLVIAAACMAEEGKSREEIVCEIEKLRPHVRASFAVDTLTYLHRGGRCSGVAALAGSTLKLHPKIVVKDGAMDAHKKYRGKRKNVIMTYAKDMEEELQSARSERVFITHSGVEDETVEEVYNYLEGLNHFDEILITRAGGVVSSHCGPGTLGVLFIA